MKKAKNKTGCLKNPHNKFLYNNISNFSGSPVIIINTIFYLFL